jgi:DNA-directed RNA polymerase specialized sigma24 family protein
VTEGENTRWSLIDAACAGDTNALNTLLERYRPAIVGFFCRTGLRREAEDLAQEVLLQFVQGQVLERADRAKGKFRDLVFAVTRHVRGHYLGGSRAQKRGSGRLRTLDPTTEVAAPEPEPTAEFDAEWFTRQVALGLARLKREYPD